MKKHINIRSIIEFSISQFLAAINFNLLLKPINIVAGGASGLSLVIANIVPLSTSDLITIIYIFCFLLSVFFLDKKTVLSIVYASILYPVAVRLTENITNLIVLEYHDIFLVCLIAGIISGVSSGLAYKNGYASGGLSCFPPIMHKYFKISISTVNFVLNTVVVLMGGYYYGINMVLYAIILLYISSYISNIIILGISRNKVIFIKSKKNDDIIHLLSNKYHINATILDSNEKKSNTLLVVVSNINYLRIKNDLIKIDHDIFFSTSDCYEVK